MGREMTCCTPSPIPFIAPTNPAAEHILRHKAVITRDEWLSVTPKEFLDPKPWRIYLAAFLVEHLAWASGGINETLAMKVKSYRNHNHKCWTYLGIVWPTNTEIMKDFSFHYPLGLSTYITNFRLSSKHMEVHLPLLLLCKAQRRDQQHRHPIRRRSLRRLALTNSTQQACLKAASQLASAHGRSPCPHWHHPPASMQVMTNPFANSCATMHLNQLEILLISCCEFASLATEQLCQTHQADKHENQKVSYRIAVIARSSQISFVDLQGSTLQEMGVAGLIIEKTLYFALLCFCSETKWSRSRLRSFSYLKEAHRLYLRRDFLSFLLDLWSLHEA